MNRQNGYLMIMNCVWLQEWTNSLPYTNNMTRRFIGFGGRMMEAIKNSGEKVISNDWWHQGDVPECFRDIMPDNAKWNNNKQ